MMSKMMNYLLVLGKTQCFLDCFEFNLDSGGAGGTDDHYQNIYRQ